MTGYSDELVDLFIDYQNKSELASDLALPVRGETPEAYARRQLEQMDAFDAAVAAKIKLDDARKAAK